MGNRIKPVSHFSPFLIILNSMVLHPALKIGNDIMKEKKKKTNRDRMRESNLRVRKWMLAHRFDQIFFKMHIRHQDTIFTQKGSYRALDLWNLFDGMCFNSADQIIFFQVKTNTWAKEKPMLEFHQKYNLHVLSFNVKKGTDGKWSVLLRIIE